jgi:site-specific DNA-adenine methylase
VRSVARQARTLAIKGRDRDLDLLSRPLTPPLKWAGGKRWLVPHIEPFWREHEKRRYVEPFCGGLAVALGLKPERAVLNDLNPHLINFYEQLRRGLSITIEARYDRKLFYAQKYWQGETSNGVRKSLRAAWSQNHAALELRFKETAATARAHLLPDCSAARRDR